MQWSSKARELMQKECIDFGKNLTIDVYKTLEQINKKRVTNGLEPKKRITKEIVEQTILNLIIDTPPGGDKQNKEKEFFAQEVMFQ